MALHMVFVITQSFILIFIMTIISPVWAGDDIDQDEAARLRQQGKILPLKDILAAVQKQHQGRIIEVELEQKRERYIYEIEIVDKNGKVWEIKLDAADAKIISQEEEG